MSILETAEPRFVRDGAILAMWKIGMDMFMIAHCLYLRESIVANRLARLRDAVSA